MRYTGIRNFGRRNFLLFDTFRMFLFCCYTSPCAKYSHRSDLLLALRSHTRLSISLMHALGTKTTIKLQHIRSLTASRQFSTLCNLMNGYAQSGTHPLPPRLQSRSPVTPQCTAEDTKDISQPFCIWWRTMKSIHIDSLRFRCSPRRFGRLTNAQELDSGEGDTGQKAHTENQQNGKFTKHVSNKTILTLLRRRRRRQVSQSESCTHFGCCTRYTVATASQKRRLTTGLSVHRLTLDDTQTKRCIIKLLSLSIYCRRIHL